MAFAYVILALILLVVLHEAGHFLAARAVGIRATKFYVFFPPALWKRRIGDVEYGIGTIPAGGFVKLPGMFEPVPADLSERVAWEWEHVLQPRVADPEERLRMDASRRAIANANAVEELAAPLSELRESVASMRAGASDRAEVRLLTKSLDRIEGMLDDLHPKAYWRAALWRRMTVIFAGPFVNLVIAFLVLSAFYWFLTPRFEVDGPVPIAKVMAESPAREAGIRSDSKIVGWNGTVDGLTPAELGDRIEEARGEPVEVAWLDGDGDRHEQRITPRVLEAGGDPLVGIEGWEVRLERTGRVVTGPLIGMRAALEQMRYITVENVTRLPRVFFDREVREDVGSVVGIVQVADEVDAAGQIVGYIAVISLILAVMNLLPLLPLDGGHLLFGVLEALRRGRPMPRAAFERYSLVGLALVLILFMIGLDNDITRARS